MSCVLFVLRLFPIKILNSIETVALGEPIPWFCATAGMDVDSCPTFPFQQFCKSGSKAPQMCGVSGLVGLVVVFVVPLLLLPFAIIVCCSAPIAFSGRRGKRLLEHDCVTEWLATEEEGSEVVWRGIGHFKTYALWASGSQGERRATSGGGGGSAGTTFGGAGLGGGVYRRICDAAKEEEDASL